MGNQDVIETLNELLEISRDGEQGFRTCAEGVRTANLRTQLEQEARRCAQSAQELETKIRSLGGLPTANLASGSARRTWTNIKSVVSGMNESAVLAECEREENAARQIYEQALQENLPADTRAIVERQYQAIKNNQERVRTLRNNASS